MDCQTVGQLKRELEKLAEDMPIVSLVAKGYYLALQVTGGKLHIFQHQVELGVDHEGIHPI